MVAGTSVIQMNKRVSIKDTILYQAVKDYKIVYDQVAMLSDADANTIKEVLQFSKQQEQPQHVSLLAEKVKNKYGIHDVKQNDEDFLNTFLTDYTHYQFEK
ncbi:MAG TPA: hypothetical protein PLU73_11900, partial [Bacteroidia bacterium]|nr:hypothetical protein [Bacteroidia bacterium]